MATTKSTTDLPSKTVSPETSYQTTSKRPASFKPRQMKVGYLYAAESGPRVPFLRMSGLWLAQAGFGIDTNIRVTVESQRLLIEVASPELVGTPCVRYTRKRFMEERTEHTTVHEP